MKEIGGYFGLEQLPGSEYHADLIAVNNARNALLYVLKARGVQKLYLPYYMCDSVARMCDREGFAYEHYHIARDFRPVFDRMLQEGEALYIVNYFGQIDIDEAVTLQRRHGTIIFDNVQAFFQRPVAGMDTVYSCRKFFGVPDGGYVATNARLQDELPEDRSGDRMKHLLGRYEGCASDYYADFKANDKSFDRLELRGMSRLTHGILGAIDYEAVRKRREQNYATLHQRLGSHNKLNLRMPVGPYAYPFYCQRGMEAKKLLAQKKIYVATLWPNVLKEKAPLEKDYAANILPLPCDQRYGSEEMEYMAAEIQMCCIELGV